MKQKIATELVTYRASDRRVYDGALCSDMQSEFDHTEALYNRMVLAEPTARCTYFPMESGYMVFTNANILDSNHKGAPHILTGVMHKDKQMALIEAIKVLEKLNTE